MKLVRRRKKNQLCTGILVTTIVCFFSLLILSPNTQREPSVLSHYIYSNSFRSLLSSQTRTVDAVQRSLTHSKPLIDFHETAPPVLDESGYFARKTPPDPVQGISKLEADRGVRNVVYLDGESVNKKRGNSAQVHPGEFVVDVLESKISHMPRILEGHHQQNVDIDLERDYLQLHYDAKPARRPQKSDPPSILIVTNRRSGSSFLGQLLNQNQRIFFNFEPLKVLERNPGVYPNQTVFLSLLLSCKFKQMPHLMEFYNKEKLHRTGSLALSSPPLCTLSGPVNNSNVRKCEKLHPSFSAAICATRYNYTAAKVIRLYNISTLQELVTREHLNLKIIHLVRDPRGILNSRSRAERRTLELGKGLDGEAGYLCRRLKSNILWARTRPPWLKGRYKLVRYEDIAYNPEKWAREIYQFIGLGEVPSEVLSWIRTNTMLSDSSSSSSKEATYSTSRNSKETAEAWRRNITLGVAKKIGQICKDALSLMNYKQVTSIGELLNMEQSLVGPLSV